LKDFFANYSPFVLHLRQRRAAPPLLFSYRSIQKTPEPIEPHSWVREKAPQYKTKKDKNITV
jgi:hypothetical protein